MSEKVQVGLPITTTQAVTAVLGMLHTPVLSGIEKDSSPGHTFARIYGDKGAYSMLSGGEKKLADIAYAIWRGTDTDGARISVLGGLDRDKRRQIILVLTYYYLGRDEWPEASPEEFAALFGRPS